MSEQGGCPVSLMQSPAARAWVPLMAVCWQVLHVAELMAVAEGWASRAQPGILLVAVDGKSSSLPTVYGWQPASLLCTETRADVVW